jgi:hypothetical protein
MRCVVTATPNLSRAVQGADVQAILQGSTGMITGGSSSSSSSSVGGGSSSNVDISNTNALLKHLNLGSKLVSSLCIQPLHLLYDDTSAVTEFRIITVADVGARNRFPDVVAIICSSCITSILSIISNCVISNIVISSRGP